MSDITAANMRDFDAHLTALAEQAGIELDGDDRRELFEAVYERGFDPNTTVQVFDEIWGDDDEDDFDLEDDDYDEDGPEDDDELPGELVADVDLQLERLQRSMGREMNEHELRAVTQTAHRQLRAGERVDLDGALRDYDSQFDTQQGRREFIQRRLQETQPEHEAPDRELDLDVATDRQAFIAARMNGVEFEEA